MTWDIVTGRNFENEFSFTATRSSGPGGQNVNKVSTRVELRFNVTESGKLTEEEKAIILEKLANRITKDGDLLIVSQSERTQYENKQKTIARFHELIRKSLVPEKKRKRTKPTLSSKLKRLEEKKSISQKKALRRLIDE